LYRLLGWLFRQDDSRALLAVKSLPRSSLRSDKTSTVAQIHGHGSFQPERASFALWSASGVGEVRHPMHIFESDSGHSCLSINSESRSMKSVCTNNNKSQRRGWLTTQRWIGNCRANQPRMSQTTSSAFLSLSAAPLGRPHAQMPGCPDATNADHRVSLSDHYARRRHG
jgi:hypothetical protein